MDENRLMQEVAYLIERSDITEETVRVNIHIGSFLKYLESNDPVAKDSDFFLKKLVERLIQLVQKVPCQKLQVKS